MCDGGGPPPEPWEPTSCHILERKRRMAPSPSSYPLPTEAQCAVEPPERLSQLIPECQVSCASDHSCEVMIGTATPSLEDSISQCPPPIFGLFEIKQQLIYNSSNEQKSRSIYPFKTSEPEFIKAFPVETDEPQFLPRLHFVLPDF